MKEGVLIVNVPEQIQKEGLMAEFMSPERRFKHVPIKIHKGDMIFGLSYRFRKMLIRQGIAEPFSINIEPTEVTHKPTPPAHKPTPAKQLIQKPKQYVKRQKTLFDFTRKP